MIYILIAVALFATDQMIKYNIDKKKKLYDKEEIFNGEITVTKQYNKGAFLGFMKKKPEVLFIINVLAMVGIIIYFIKEIINKGNVFIKLGLALIVGGALSNVYDRIVKKHVVDYFSLKKIKKIVFNLGDMFIFLGSFLIIIYSLFKD